MYIYIYICMRWRVPRSIWEMQTAATLRRWTEAVYPTPKNRCRCLWARTRGEPFVGVSHTLREGILDPSLGYPRPFVGVS